MDRCASASRLDRNPPPHHNSGTAHVILKDPAAMTKYGCTMVSGADIFYATVIAEDVKQAREMAAAETRKGRPREWNIAVLETDVEGPPRFLGSGSQDA